MSSVCIYSPSEKIWGGGQIYIESLCRHLNVAGLPSKIATAEPESFACDTVFIPSVASRGSRLRHALKFARQLQRAKFELVVLNDLSSLWLAPVFRSQGLKVVSLLHLYLQRRGRSGLGHGWMEYRLLQFASRFADKILSVNKDNEEVFPVPVTFVGNFVPEWFFEHENRRHKRFDLGVIARLAPQKNIPLFLELVYRINQVSRRPVTAVLVGSGPLEVEVSEHIARLGIGSLIEVRSWVAREDLPALFDQIRCFAITSHHEGFATTLLEAHARGVPAISTRSAGYCAEFLEDICPNTGFSFVPRDLGESAFLERVSQLLDMSGLYFDDCVRKARLFCEDRVLGQISDEIRALLPSRNTDTAP